jgi:hypothetical protein
MESDQEAAGKSHRKKLSLIVKKFKNISIRLKLQDTSLRSVCQAL